MLYDMQLLGDTKLAFPTNMSTLNMFQDSPIDCKVLVSIPESPDMFREFTCARVIPMVDSLFMDGESRLKNCGKSYVGVANIVRLVDNITLVNNVRR